MPRKRSDITPSESSDSSLLTRREAVALGAGVVAALAAGRAVVGGGDSKGHSVATRQRANGAPESRTDSVLPRDVRLTRRAERKIPAPFMHAIKQAAHEIRLPRHQAEVLLAAWVMAEDGFQNHAYADGDALGLFQMRASAIKDGTFAYVGIVHPKDAMDPAKAATAMAKAYQLAAPAHARADLASIEHVTQGPFPDGQPYVNGLQRLVDLGFVTGTGLEAHRGCMENGQAGRVDASNRAGKLETFCLT